MKNDLCRLGLFCFLAMTTASGTVTAAEVKIATVDLQRLTKEYYRAQEVARQLQARQTALAKELDTLRVDGQKLLKETQELQERTSDLGLSAAGRETIRKSFETKIGELRAFEIKYENARAQRQAELQTQVMQANKRVFDDILASIKRVGDREGLNLVLDASKIAPGPGLVLYTRNLEDLTDRVLLSLNSTRPPP
jgi:Skp family chaperone for outer membrane proteins